MAKHRLTIEGVGEPDTRPVGEALAADGLLRQAAEQAGWLEEPMRVFASYRATCSCGWAEDAESRFGATQLAQRHNLDSAAD